MRDRDSYNAYHREYHKQRYWKIKAEVVGLLGGKCAVCGTTEQLEIDHIDPSTKTIEVSRFNSVSRVRLLEEIKLCQLLCSDHHKTKSVEEQSVGHGGGLSGKKNCKCEPCKARKREYMKNWKRSRLGSSAR